MASWHGGNVSARRTKGDSRHQATVTVDWVPFPLHPMFYLYHQMWVVLIQLKCSVLNPWLCSLRVLDVCNGGRDIFKDTETVGMPKGQNKYRKRKKEKKKARMWWGMHLHNICSTYPSLDDGETHIKRYFLTEIKKKIQHCSLHLSHYWVNSVIVNWSVMGIVHYQRYLSYSKTVFSTGLEQGYSFTSSPTAKSLNFYFCMNISQFKILIVNAEGSVYLAT